MRARLVSFGYGAGARINMKLSSQLESFSTLPCMAHPRFLPPAPAYPSTNTLATGKENLGWKCVQPYVAVPLGANIQATVSNAWQTSLSHGNKFSTAPHQQSGNTPQAGSGIPGNSYVFVAASRTTWWSWVSKKIQAAGNAVLSLAAAPAVPLALGLAGAIPFVVLTPPVYNFVPLPKLLEGREIEAQAAYGACILSFLGAPHWGLAMASHAENGKVVTHFTITSFRYLWSVIPSLLAWPALLLPPVQKFIILISSLGIALGVDTVMARHTLVPKWYLPLRVTLTSIAATSMGVSLAYSLAQPTAKSKAKSD